MLAELSATFVRIPPEQVDQELTQWLQRIGLFLKIDRSVIAQVNPANGEVLITHQWAREGVRVNPIGLNVGQGHAMVERENSCGRIDGLVE